MHHPLLLSSFEKNQKSINPVYSKTTAIGCGIYPRAEIDRKDFRKFELKKEHFIRNRVHIKCVFCFLNTFFGFFLSSTTSYIIIVQKSCVKMPLKVYVGCENVIDS